MSKGVIIPAVAVSLLLVIACRQTGPAETTAASANGATQTTPVDSPSLTKVIESAMEQTRQTIGYDPAYTRLNYPGGDVPINTGVCSDVIVRAFRRAGVDLQREVHEDMKRNFDAYPKRWGLARPDTNIDHRRVPNLMTYFKRSGKSVEITMDAKDYLPGDVVAWELTNGLPHIGIVSNVKSGNGDRYSVVHNIGAGARLEDVIFSWRIIGHYRYF